MKLEWMWPSIRHFNLVPSIFFGKRQIKVSSKLLPLKMTPPSLVNGSWLSGCAGTRLPNRQMDVDSAMRGGFSRLNSCPFMACNVHTKLPPRSCCTGNCSNRHGVFFTVVLTPTPAEAPKVPLAPCASVPMPAPTCTRSIIPTLNVWLADDFDMVTPVPSVVSGVTEMNTRLGK